MIKVDGVTMTLKNLEDIGVDIDRATKEGVLATAWQVRNDAAKSIQEKSNGETVQRSRQGGGTYEHTASKAGDAPNTDTGTLVRSIAVELGPFDSALVGSDVKYSSDLEFGTKKMDARPWLKPALEKNIKNLDKNIESAIKRQIK